MVSAFVEKHAEVFVKIKPVTPTSWAEIVKEAELSSRMQAEADLREEVLELVGVCSYTGASDSAKNVHVVAYRMLDGVTMDVFVEKAVLASPFGYLPERAIISMLYHLLKLANKLSTYGIMQKDLKLANFMAMAPQSQHLSAVSVR